MGIVFTKKAEPTKATPETKAVTKAAPEAKPEAVSKKKLSGVTTSPKTAQASVNVEKKNNKTKEVETLVNEVEDTGIPMAIGAISQKPVIGYNFGFTMNAGEFQSYRAQVHLSMPVDEGEDINEVFSTMKDWVDAKVQAIGTSLQEAE
jgi:hypothetical protein